MAKAGILALILLLAGCGHTDPIRVQDFPEPPHIEKPERPYIPEGTAPSEVVRQVMDYVLVVEGKLNEALEALKVYRRK